MVNRKGGASKSQTTHDQTLKCQNQFEVIAMRIQSLVFILAIVFISSRSSYAQQDTLQVIAQIDAPGIHPWNLTYHDGNIWVSDDSLNRIYKISEEGTVLDSIQIENCSLRGLTFKNDALWVINNKSIGDTVLYREADSIRMPLYSMYALDKDTGEKSDSILFMGEYSRHVDFFGLQYFHSKFYLSFNGGWGPAMFEIDPYDGTRLDICCAHPCGMTIMNDTLWSVRQDSMDGRGNSVTPLIISLGQDSTLSSITLWDKRCYLNFCALGICFDGDHLWILDVDSKKINKMEKILTGIDVGKNKDLPSELSVSQNYPNPFNSTTSIKFSLSQRSRVVISIFDCSGKRIKTLVNSDFNSGFHTVRWFGLNDHAESVSSGLYVYEIKTNRKLIRKKMLLLK